MTVRYCTESVGYLPREAMPHGMRDTVVAVAGKRYRFSGLGSSQQAAIRARFDSHVVNDISGAFDIRFFIAPRELFHSYERVSWEYELNFEYSHDRVWLEGLGFIAVFQRAPESGASVWTWMTDGEHFDGVFENILRVVTAYRLSRRDALLLHSSAVDRGGHSSVFVGRSGAGKTTLARMAMREGFGVPSDDLNAVVLEPDGVKLHPVPFSGELRSPFSSEPRSLDAIYLLQQATIQRVTPVSSALAVTRLFSCCPFVNRDPHCAERVMGVVEELVRRCRPATLEFPRKQMLWDTVCRAA